MRAALFDDMGELVPDSLVKAERSFRTDADGAFTLDADEAVEQARIVIDRVLEGRDENVRFVSFCAFWHSLCGLDSNGRAVSEILGWADTRARRYSAMLKENFDENAIHARTGAHFHSSFWPAKLLWLRHERPRDFERAAAWHSFADVCQQRLFGDARTGISMASATGLFDQRECRWDGELLRFIGVGEGQLPTVLGADAAVRPDEAARKRWPQLADAEILPAIGDGAAENVGSGSLRLGEATLTIGTSAAVRMAYEGDPPASIPRGLWSYRIDDKRVIVGGALSDGGNLIELIRARFNVRGDISEELRARAFDPKIRVEPFFFGERSTGYREDAKGSIEGVSEHHDGVDVILAAMYAVAERLADIVERLERVAPIRRITASGGALREFPRWRSVIEEKLGRTLETSDAAEAALKGAALLALERLGTIKL